MVALSHHLKIVQSVIAPVAILMVDMFRLQKGSSEVPFHDETMFSHTSPVTKQNSAIAIVDSSSPVRSSHCPDLSLKTVPKRNPHA